MVHVAVKTSLKETKPLFDGLNEFLGKHAETGAVAASSLKASEKQLDTVIECIKENQVTSRRLVDAFSASSQTYDNQAQGVLSYAHKNVDSSVAKARAEAAVAREEAEYQKNLARM